LKIGSEGEYLGLRGTLTGGRRKLHNDFHDLNPSPNIVRVIRSRRIRWAGHVVRRERGEVYTTFWWRNLGKRDHLEDQGVKGRIILRWIFRKWDVEVWTE
jgi:hypothetical protein